MSSAGASVTERAITSMAGNVCFVIVNKAVSKKKSPICCITFRITLYIIIFCGLGGGAAG